jgi:predicted porin
MKNNNLLMLISVLLSGVCSNATAQSNVTLYGIVDAGLGYSSNQLGNHNTYVRSGNKDANRLGFRGIEDIGGGTQVQFTLESGFNLDDGTFAQSGVLFNRQAFVGISNKKLGTLTAGRQYSPYYNFLSPLGPVPVVTGTLGDHPGDIDGFDVTIRHNNALKYISPDWHGASVGLMAAAGEQAGHHGTGGAVSAAAKYDRGAWRYALGYQMLKNGVQQATWDPTSSSSFIKSPINAGYLSAQQVQYLAAAIRYQDNKLGVGGSLSNVQYRPNATSRFSGIATFNTAAVLASWQTASPWLLGAGLSYTRTNAANGITDTANYRQLTLQQAYWLSKRTSIYLLEAVQRARGKTLGANGVSLIDAVASVGGSNGATPSSDGSQNVYMLGVRHAF